MLRPVCHEHDAGSVSLAGYVVKQKGYFSANGNSMIEPSERLFRRAGRNWLGKWGGGNAAMIAVTSTRPLWSVTRRYPRRAAEHAVSTGQPI
jgi:hypothetical protein